MDSERGKFSKKELVRVIGAVEKLPAGSNKVIIEVAKAIGAGRPLARPLEIKDRIADLQIHRRTMEMWMNDKARKAGETDNPWEAVPIIASNKVIATQLETEWITAMRLIKQKFENKKGRKPSGITRHDAQEICQQVEKINHRDNLKHGHNLAVTIGLELEIGSREETSRRAVLASMRELDSLQELGIPTTYDWRRELPLPYSQGSTGQMRALFEFFKMGLLRRNDSAGLHVNIGNFEWLNRSSPEPYLLQVILDAADLFDGSSVWLQKRRVYQRDLTSPRLLPEQMRKHVFEGDFYSARGLPYVVREGQKILEMRDLPLVNHKNFFGYVKDLITFCYLADAAAAHNRVEHRRIENGLDYKKAREWDVLVSQLFQISDGYGFGTVSTIYEEIKSGKLDQDHYENRVGKLRGQILGVIDTQPGYKTRIATLCFELRKAIQEINVSA